MIFVLSLYVCFVCTILLFMLGASERDLGVNDRKYVILLALCVAISLTVCLLSILLKDFMISAI